MPVPGVPQAKLPLMLVPKVVQPASASIAPPTPRSSVREGRRRHFETGRSGRQIMRGHFERFMSGSLQPGDERRLGAVPFKHRAI